VIAIVNATPDSFYAASRVGTGAGLREALGALLDAQPDAVDVGGQSTRPGSARVGAAEELRRVLPVIAALRELSAALPITVDTFCADVAREGLSAGADGVNDISAGRLDPALLGVVAASGCGYVLMHMQGEPQTMQQAPEYADCLGEVRGFLAAELARLERLGVARERVVLDPGIGFGKRLPDNLALIRGAEALAALGRPLLYGVSRKSFIGKLGGAEDPAARLPGTLGVTWELLCRGVMLHRVHDPRPVRQLIAVWEAVHAGA
jgi:dihydropteroate synthase